MCDITLNDFRELVMHRSMAGARVCLDILDVVIRLASTPITIVFTDIVIQMILVTSAAIRVRNDILRMEQNTELPNMDIEYGFTNLIHGWLNVCLPQEMGFGQHYPRLMPREELDVCMN